MKMTQISSILWRAYIKGYMVSWTNEILKYATEKYYIKHKSFLSWTKTI